MQGESGEGDGEIVRKYASAARSSEQGQQRLARRVAWSYRLARKLMHAGSFRYSASSEGATGTASPTANHVAAR